MLESIILTGILHQWQLLLTLALNLSTGGLRLQVGL